MNPNASATDRRSISTFAARDRVSRGIVPYDNDVTDADSGNPTGESGAPDTTGESASAGRRRRRFVVTIEPVSIVAIVVAAVAALFVFPLVRPAATGLTHLAIGVLLGLALFPLVVKVRERLRCRHTVAVAIVGGAVLFFAVLVGLVMGPPAVSQAEKFGKQLPETVEGLYDLPIVGPRLEKADAADAVDRWVQDLPARINSETVADVTRSLLTGAVALVTVVLIALAVLLDGEILVSRTRRLLPAPAREHADEVARILYRVIGKYFAGSLVVAFLAGMYILAIGLVMGVPLAPIAALWMVITDLIPQIGGFLGGAFFTVLAVSQGVTIGLVCLILYLIYMNLENHVISPLIVGEAVDLSPPTTMLAALMGGAAGGIPGALFATPLAGAVKQLYFEFRFDRTTLDDKPRRRPLRTFFRRLSNRATRR
jgi:predicted PurR-regulated permease PerM